MMLSTLIITFILITQSSIVLGLSIINMALASQSMSESIILLHDPAMQKK